MFASPHSNFDTENGILAPSARPQIDLRFSYLTQLENGTVRPDDWNKVPRSLTGIAEWDAPELGIKRIGSPNTFSGNHPRYGITVKKIGALLKKIDERHPLRPPAESYTSFKVKLERSTSRERELEQQLGSLLAELHVHRQDEEDRAVASDQKAMQVRNMAERLIQQETEIQRLRQGKHSRGTELKEPEKVSGPEMPASKKNKPSHLVLVKP
ncbi:hypothetical protein ACC757_23720 [Rhizobium ruizarguesonis]